MRVESGGFPGPRELLADVQDDNVGVYDGAAGDALGLVQGPELAISGRGRSLPGGEQVQDENVIVLYASAATVAELSGEAGYPFSSEKISSLVFHFMSSSSSLVIDS